MAFLVFRCEGEAIALCEGQGLCVAAFFVPFLNVPSLAGQVGTLGFDQGILCMEGEDAEIIINTVVIQVNLIALALVGGGQEFEVESGLTLQIFGHIAGQNHLQQNAVDSGGGDQIISQSAIGAAGEGHRNGNGVVLGVVNLGASAGSRGSVPLLGGGQQMQVAVGGNTHTVQGQFDTAQMLVAERAGERIIIHKYVEGIRTNGSHITVVATASADFHEVAGFCRCCIDGEYGQHTKNHANHKDQRQCLLEFSHVFNSLS